MASALPKVITPDQWRQAVNQTKAKARQRSIPGEMNKTEAAYWEHLSTLKLLRKIADVRFQPMHLKLAPKTFYQIDFLVVSPDGYLQVHEVKGRGKKINSAGEVIECPRYEDDAIVKVKVAAEYFPWFDFYLVFQRKSGDWEQIPVGNAA